MHPVFYYLQNQHTTALVDRFGDFLQRLSVAEKHLLRTALSQYSFGLRFAPYAHGSTTDNAVEDAGFVDEDGDWGFPGETDDFETAIELLDGLTATDADSLIDALSDQIRHYTFVGGQK